MAPVPHFLHNGNTLPTQFEKSVKSVIVQVLLGIHKIVYISKRAPSPSMHQAKPTGSQGTICFALINVLPENPSSIVQTIFGNDNICVVNFACGCVCLSSFSLFCWPSLNSAQLRTKVIMQSNQTPNVPTTLDPHCVCRPANTEIAQQRERERDRKQRAN